MSGAFWTVPPLANPTPWLLHRTGITAVGRQDGRTMMAVGWALWDLVSIGENQAYDFIYDGFGLWRAEPGYEPAEGIAFLAQVFDRLDADDPVVPSDIHAADPAVVTPLSVYYGARCWAGTELASTAGQPELTHRVCDAIRRSHPAFVPPRSQAFLNHHGG